MDAQKFALHIVGLSKIEALELAEMLGEPNLRRETDPGEDSRFGDLAATVALVVVASSAIQGLAIWLAKRRIRAEDIETVSIEKMADGSMRVNIQRINRSGSSDTPSPAAIEALASALRSALDTLPPPPTP